MSKNTKPASNEMAEEKKIQTKYDRKVQRRKEEAERAKKEKTRNTIITVVIAVLLVAFVASFPIRKSLALKAPYYKVNEEAVTRVEFDYHRALVKANFLNQNSYYFEMFGLDMSTIETQQFDDTLTFAEYFDQMASEQIIEVRALSDAGRAAGFEYDTTEEYEQSIANVKEMAEEQDVSYKEYLKSIYGSFATESSLEDIMKESLYANAYKEKIKDEKEPSEDAIIAHYEADKGSYDSVDYHMLTFDAQLPTTAPDGSVPTDEEGNEIAYEPTEEEIAAAMEEAKKEAEAARATIAQDGEEYINVNIQEEYMQENLYNFLFDDSRKPGDTCVVENTPDNGYIVASFDKRYRDETPTYSTRAIITNSKDSQTILNEWKEGAATEESFIEILKKYDEAGSIVNDGLYEGISENMVNDELYSWLSAPERKAGDTFALNIEDDANYVLYYVGTSDPEWMNTIRDSLLTEAMDTYLEEITSKYTIQDEDGKLKYLTIPQAEEQG